MRPASHREILTNTFPLHLLYGAMTRADVQRSSSLTPLPSLRLTWLVFPSLAPNQSPDQSPPPPLSLPPKHTSPPTSSQ